MITPGKNTPEVELSTNSAHNDRPDVVPATLYAEATAESEALMAELIGDSHEEALQVLEGTIVEDMLRAA